MGELIDNGDKWIEKKERGKVLKWLIKGFTGK